MSESAEIKSLLVPAEAAGQRLDQWLATQLPDVSRVRVQQLIEQKKIQLAGATPKPSMRLRGGEQITITGQVQLPPLHAFPEDIPIDVVYEDNDIAVINKAAGMSVHAGSGKGESGSKGTLVNALLHRFGKLSDAGGELRPGIVHRLDKQTSGLMIVAKTDVAHRRLAQQFLRRAVKKTYLTLVHGWMPETQGTIKLPISRDLLRRERMTTRRKEGRTAVTHWKLLKKLDARVNKTCVIVQGQRTRPAKVQILSAEPSLPPRDPPIRFRKSVPTGWLEITLMEGRNRQVRRMTATVGHPTLRLVRVGIGDLRLNNLAPGEWRKLTNEELKALKKT